VAGVAAESGSDHRSDSELAAARGAIPKLVEKGNPAEPSAQACWSRTMIRYTLGIGLALSVLGGPWSLALAKDYNTSRPYLPPAGQVKVNNARAQLFAIQNQVDQDAKKAEEQGSKSGCPQGVFVNRTNPRVDVVIATQDIVNLGGNIDLSGCR
jgi:hypothetical protein